MGQAIAVSSPVVGRWDDRRVIGIESFGRQAAPTYPRRQQHRRMFRASRSALMSVPAAILGLYLLAAGAAVPGAALLVLAVTLGFRARHWQSLAARSGVGAGSEDAVQRALDPLRREGWRVHHSVLWRGGFRRQLTGRPSPFDGGPVAA